MKSGYTLPVFAIAAAKAAILRIHHPDLDINTVDLDILESTPAQIAIAQSAPLTTHTALAITVSDPGDNLDLTAGMSLWAWVNLEIGNQQIILEGGEGIGKTSEGHPAIYSLTHKLATLNLLPLLKAQQRARIRFILPTGRAIAKRTANAAFGILEGLSLLGTTGISQPLSVADQLAKFQEDLQTKAQSNSSLVFYIGANSYQTAINMGFGSSQLVQTANWIGAMLVAASLHKVETITLLGYHGKLLKLAGGIFHTSSHLADARIDILTRTAVHLQLPLPLIQAIERSPTAEAVHQLLKEHDQDQLFFQYLTQQIQTNASAYIQKYADQSVKVKVFLCDRHSQLILKN